MGLRVGLTFDAKGGFRLRPEDPPDLIAEFDSDETIANVERAIRSGAHEVIRLGNARSLLNQLPDLNVDIVFNIAEGLTGRTRESEVPVLLDMVGVPYVGSDGMTLALTLDKALTKKIFIAEKIPTPRFKELAFKESAELVDLRYPLFVKLRYEGSSKGLNQNSLVTNPEELTQQVKYLRRMYPGAAILVEEFIEGQECTVAIVGNDPPEVYPIVQTFLDGEKDLGRKFYAFSYLQRGASYVCPAPMPEDLAEKIRSLALQVYQAVECRDFGRVDFRIDVDDNPYVLEINPLPSLSVEDVFTFIGKPRGESYNQIVCRVIEAAVKRCGLMQAMPEKSSIGV